MKIQFKAKIHECKILGATIKVPKLTQSHVILDDGLGQIAPSKANKALCAAGMGFDSRRIDPSKLVCVQGGFISTFEFTC
jgi:hypothetical protein